MQSHTILFIVLVAKWTICVEGHGRLVQPPSRSTMWRYGYKTPPNYNDNQLFCGGFSIQWTENGGKCGVCGDRYDAAVHDNEAPNGKYANGILTGTYKAGEVIEIRVNVTANHKGYFEYRLCKNDDPKAAVTQECFDKHLLASAYDTTKTRFTIKSSMFHIAHKVKLPDGVKCKACVLQWKYNTANSWGDDFETGKGCIGCGPQEQFYACADIAIGEEDVVMPTPDGPVVVPDGEDDDEPDDTNEYDTNGHCKCQCAQTSSSSGNMNPSTIVVLLCSVFVPILAFFV